MRALTESKERCTSCAQIGWHLSACNLVQTGKANAKYDQATLGEEFRNRQSFREER